MSANFNDDFPLFPSENNLSDDGKPSKSSKSTPNIAIIEAEADIKRKDKMLTFSFDLIKIFLMVCGSLVIIDALMQQLGISDSLTSEFFDLLKYSLTTVLGYLFASEHKK